MSSILETGPKKHRGEEHEEAEEKEQEKEMSKWGNIGLRSFKVIGKKTLYK